MVEVLGSHVGKVAGSGSRKVVSPEFVLVKGTRVCDGTGFWGTGLGTEYRVHGTSYKVGVNGVGLQGLVLCIGGCAEA